MNSFTLTVPKYLNFNMARSGKIFFDIDFVIAKGSFALRSGRAEGSRHLFNRISHFHSTSTATGRGFDNYGISKFFADLEGCGYIRNATRRARNTRYAKGTHGIFSTNFISHNPDVIGSWANEADVMVLKRLHKTGIFGQKPIAWVNSISTGNFGGGDDRRDAQIAVSA